MNTPFNIDVRAEGAVVTLTDKCMLPLRPEHHVALNAALERSNRVVFDAAGQTLHSGWLRLIETLTLSAASVDKTVVLVAPTETTLTTADAIAVKENLEIVASIEAGLAL